MRQPNIVMIGGGTGSFTLLQALKHVTPELTALVNMSDDGGSTGVLRDELGVLPPGDIRQCLVALSDAPQELLDLFSFRFGGGALAGHSFGNLFLSAVEKMTGDFGQAVRLASTVLRIQGRVLPITTANTRLVLRQPDGSLVEGENTISTIALGARPELYLKPAAPVNPEAEAAILAADLVVIAPGGLYGSLAPCLLVEGVAAALQRTPATVAYVCNLVNRQQQTPDFAVADYAAEIERFAGAGVLDYVLYNQAEPTPELLERYALENEFPVSCARLEMPGGTYQPVGGNFIAHHGLQRDPADTRIRRSLIRHDAVAVAAALLSLVPSA